MLKAFCVTGFIQGSGRFHVITVKDPGKIPWQIKDLDGGSRHGVRYFEDAVVQSDGGVVVDPAFSLHAEQISDIGYFGQLAASVFPGKSFLKGADAKAAMDALVVFCQVLVQIAVEIVNAICDHIAQELISDGSKKAFNLPAALGPLSV